MSESGPRVNWTGQPFVDAGLAALAAAVGVRTLAELGPDHLAQACSELRQVLLSDEALGLDVETNFARGALALVFPNSELANPNSWRGSTAEEQADHVRQVFAEALTEDLAAARSCWEGGGEAVCGICGQRRPNRAFVSVRRSRMPLLAGIVNFYPGFAWGVSLCGICGLALRFVPLAVFRSGGRGGLWFLHVQNLDAIAPLIRRYGWDHFHQAIAAHQAVGFYGKWATSGEAGTVLYVLCELMENRSSALADAQGGSVPVTAYVFSNDNRNPSIRALPIPHPLLRFFALLHTEAPNAFRRFRDELLRVDPDLAAKERSAREGFVHAVAAAMLQRDALLGLCLDSERGELRGGWIGHRRYLREVRKMPAWRIKLIEQLARALSTQEQGPRIERALAVASRDELIGQFLDFVRRGWLAASDLYRLLPPSDYRSADELRDALLAALYELRRAQAEGRDVPAFPAQDDASLSAADEAVLRRVEEIGERLASAFDNFSRLVGEMARARSAEQLRRLYLLGVRRGALSFSDFCFLAPWNEAGKCLQLRDYLLAYLYSRRPDAIPEEQAEELSPASGEGERMEAEA